MKYIISALLITSGLVFLGLSQRYDYPVNTNYRLDRLTGEMMGCEYDEKVKKNYCVLVVEGTGIFKM